MNITANIHTPSIHTQIYRACVEKDSEHDYYTGEYEVTPKTSAQELATKNKTLKKNIKVLAIPFYEVSNKDGTTAIIAD